MDFEWENFIEVFHNKRVVKYYIPKENPDTLYMTEFKFIGDSPDKDIRITLSREEAKKVKDELDPLLFTSELDKKLPFKLKDKIVLSSEDEVKKTMLTLTAFLKD